MGYIARLIVIINIRYTCNSILFAGKLTKRIVGVFVYYYAVLLDLGYIAEIIIGIGDIAVVT